MKLTKGSDLNQRQVQQVKNAFVYRLTTENGYPKRNPCKARVPAISDKQWIAEHAFYIKNDGTLADKPGHCEPVWMVDTERE